MHPVIVGIDPGTTSAFAILDFNFNLVTVKSRRNYSFAGMISDIYKFGNPIIVGTDKKEAPSFIREFSQKTGARIFCPDYDTKKGEKDRIVKTKYFRDMTKNTHEVDALASAIYAYNEYLPLIKKIKAFAEENKKDEIIDKIFIKVITEDRNISDAVSDIEKKPVKTKAEEIILRHGPGRKELTKEEREIRLLKDLVLSQREELFSLRSENLELRNKKIDISSTTKKIISFKERRAIETESELKKIKKDNERKNKIIKNLNLFVSGLNGFIIIKKLENLGREEFEHKRRILNIGKNVIIYAEDISISGDNVIEELKGNVKIIIYGKGINKELKKSFILLEKKNIEIIETKYFGKIKNDELQKALEKQKAPGISLKDIIEEYKNERLRDNIK